MTRYVNACKISNFLLYCQSSNPEPVLNCSIINFLDLPSDNYEEDINSKGLNNGKKKIRQVNIDNDKKNIRPADIDKQRPAIPN